MGQRKGTSIWVNAQLCCAARSAHFGEAAACAASGTAPQGPTRSALVLGVLRAGGCRA